MFLFALIKFSQVSEEIHNYIINLFRLGSKQLHNTLNGDIFIVDRIKF